MKRDEKNLTPEAEKKIRDSLFTQAKKLEEYHKQIKTMHPTDYIKRMQPYFNAIIGYKKKNKIKNTIEAAIELCQGTKTDAIKVWLLATAVEMIKNQPDEPGKENTGG